MRWSSSESHVARIRLLAESRPVQLLWRLIDQDRLRDRSSRDVRRAQI